MQMMQYCGYEEERKEPDQTRGSNEVPSAKKLTKGPMNEPKKFKWNEVLKQLGSTQTEGLNKIKQVENYVYLGMMINNRRRL